MNTNTNLYHELEKRFSIFRWFIILVVAPTMILLSDYHEDVKYIIIVLIIGSIYNLFITIAAFNKRLDFHFSFKYTLYFDIPLISLFVFISGGLQSEIYLLYYLFILYNGAKFGFRGTINSLAQSVFYFTLASLLASTNGDFDYKCYIVRIINLIILLFVMYEVNHRISESLMKEKKARELAYKDPLTQLPNRLLMSDHFDKMCNQFNISGQSFAIVIIDIDNFKHINDTKGHAMGDKVLQSLAKIFVDCLTEDDFLCRFGGEEFLGFFADSNKTNSLNKANLIHDKIEQFDFWGIKITVSIGVNLYKKEYTMFENISFADEAMYAVKNTGKNKVLFYDELAFKLNKTS